ncbi:MAG: MmgE/PrpD family protein [Hyphomicrobiales bacterium]
MTGGTTAPLRRDEPLSGILATFYTGLTAESLPAATLHAVRRHVLDTMGAALAGARQPEPSAVLRAGSVLWGEQGTAVLWGRAEPAPPALAALVNGTAAHALELDDASGCDHSGAVVVPAVFAALPLATGASDADLIAAIVAGYDLGRRVMEAAGGYDAHNNAGWHSTGTCGVFAAAIAVSRLRRLSADTARHALGIAGSFASGNWAFLQDGAMTKRLHPGNAASAGLLATELAIQGMTGPAHIFEARWGGFLSTYARSDADPHALISGLGESWRIHRSSIKPFASCRGTHAAVEAVLAMRANIAEDIVEIEASVTPTVARMCGGRSAASLVDAQMSLPYALSVAWLHGAADLSRFSEDVRASDAIRDWLGRMRIIADPGIASNVAARVGITTCSGEAHEMMIESPLGSWDRPLPDEALRAKYRSLATPVLGDDGAARLEATVWSLGGGIDPASLPVLLASGPSSRGRE